MQAIIEAYMFRIAVAPLLFSAIFWGQVAAVHRDWKKFPAIYQTDTTQNIYVIGDPHANPARLSALLLGAKIISGIPQQPSDISWGAGESIVVFTGDFIDKGPDALTVIALIRALQTEAAKDGGQVIATMGNHEAEFLANPIGEKTSEFARELRIAGLQPAAVAACQGDLGRFLCNLPFAARVNDWFFSHAGNTAGRTLAKLESDLEGGIANDGFATPQLMAADSLLEARLSDPPWFEPKGANAETTLKAYCKALGVNHIVEGHQHGQVQFADGVKRKAGEMFQRYGIIFLEDTGMSEGVEDSHGAALLISPTKKTATAICSDGASTIIWDAGTHQDQGSIPPCGGK